MTSTHLEPVTTAVESFPDPSISQQDSPSADSSFSDAYDNEAPAEKVVHQDETHKAGSDVTDDYAMTFDSEGEEHADSQDTSQANIVQATQAVSVPVSETASISSTTSLEPPTDVPQIGQETQPAHTSPPPIHPTAVRSSDSPATQSPVETTQLLAHTYEDIASGGIDIQQLLDNITANAEKNESTSTVATPTSTAGSSLPSHISLPPRPSLPQKRPYDDFQNYHTGAPGVSQAPVTNRAPGVAIIAAGAPGTSTDSRVGLPPPPAFSTNARGGLPPPPSASFGPSPYSTPGHIQASYTPQINQLSGQGHQPKSVDSLDDTEEVDAKWGPDIQRLYDEFLIEEQRYVTEGLWERFPNGSRLFIGNLPSEKVTKRDIFHVFHHHGRLAQISIKNAYGFVQFHDSAACYAALRQEQGVEVRGRKMHLEISKPQKNSRNAQMGGAQPSRRSRSPDRQRGNGKRTTGGDRYDTRATPAFRPDEYGRPIRVRDDYRPVRSPTPPRGNFNNRDGYTHRARDSYDGGRSRRRSRSPSPYGRDNDRDNGRYRERSLSPRSKEAYEDANLQLPRRDPRNSPDVQIIVMDQLDRAFVAWVENEMRGRGVNVDVMFLDSRYPVEAVVRRQILEGVHAVSKLDFRSQSSSTISLQVFDRQGGAHNVRFDEYQDLEPKIAAELVLRAKHTPPQVQAPSYSQQQPAFAGGQIHQPSTPAPQKSDFASQLGQMDNATLQKLLGSLTMPQQQQQQQQQLQQHNHPVVSANSAIDLASLLGGLQPPAPQQGYIPQHQAALDPYASIASNPALASLLGNAPPQQQPQPQQSAQQVQNIMAQLARFRQ